ncbi:hypothetical protein [Nocardia sp. NPDC056100]|uniref:DUF6630 family protein n=1 Tax=Nocardia sp. NPDC056100 TaxID=3345712 RepID=UPI0035DA5385
MSSQEWDSFAVNLAGVLTRSPPHTVVNLETGLRSLGITKAENGLSLCLTDDVSTESQQRLRDTGWAGPDSDKLWWYRIRGTGFVACRDIARTAGDVLRSVLEVTSPGTVQAEGWVDAYTDMPVPLGQLRACASSPIADEVRVLLSVAELLLCDYPWLVAAVRYRLTDPQESHTLGLWRGLLDILGEPYFGGLGVLAQCDWRQRADQMRELLQRLPSHPESLSWDWFPEFLVSTAGSDSGDIAEALLDRVGTRSAPLGVALVSFDTEGDDYAVAFVPLAQVERLDALTALAGHRMTTLPFASAGHSPPSTMP